MAKDTLALLNHDGGGGNASTAATAVGSHREAGQSKLEPSSQPDFDSIPATNQDRDPNADRSQATDKIMLGLSRGSLLLLAFLVGIWVSWKEIWPFEPHMRTAFLGFEALWDTYAVPKNPMDTDVWRRISGSDQPKGVTTFVPERAFDGVTLVTFGTAAGLIDMNGAVVHQWHMPVRELEAFGITSQGPAPDTWHYWKPAYLFPNGDLIAIVDRMHSTPEGVALIKLDRQSRPIWVFAHAVHHDFDLDGSGTVYVLDQELRNEPPPGLPALVGPLIDEGVVVLSPNGEPLARVSIAEAFERSDYRELVNEFALENPDVWGDYLHSNNLDVVQADLAEAFEFLEEGQILLSFREISTIAVLDLEERRIVWAAKGQWHMQHDPDLLSNGNMLLFDNRGDWARGGGSRVIEFNPLSRQVVWQFPSRQGQTLDSTYRAGQQKLPNGNVLINDFYQGRLIEVAEDGSIVWEYHCPFAHPEHAGLVCRPMSAWRYKREELAFLMTDRHLGNAPTEPPQEMKKRAALARSSHETVR